MYNNPASTIAMGSAGLLAVTGGAGPMNPLWIVLGGFALASTALAIGRTAPKTQA